MSSTPPPRADGEALLWARGLEVGYDHRAILPPLDVSIEAGAFWALLGQNGAGKTTLLRTLVGLLPPVSGTLERRAHLVMGYVPQRSTLDLSVPSRVIDILESGRDRAWSFLRPWRSWRNREPIHRALDDARLRDISHERYADLSEGQKQRVLVGRALACNPDLLVLDEPTSAMDLDSEQMVFELLETVRNKRGLTILLISHDVERVMRAASHAILVDKSQGLAMAARVGDLATSERFVQLFGPVAAALAQTPRKAGAALAMDGERPGVRPS